MSESGIVRRLDTLASEANELHGQIDAAMRTTVSLAIECGGKLAEAKEAVGHGDWLAWLGEHFAGGERTAQRYLAIHRGRNLVESAAEADLGVMEAERLVVGAEKEAAREESPAKVEPDAQRGVGKVTQRLEAAQAIVGAAVADVRGLRKVAEGSERVWLSGLLGTLEDANALLVEFVESATTGGE